MLLAGAQCSFGAHTLVGRPGAVSDFANKGNVVLSPLPWSILQQDQGGAEGALLVQRHADQALNAPQAQACCLCGGTRVMQHVFDHHQLVVLQVVDEVAIVGKAHALAVVTQSAVAPVALDGGVLSARVDGQKGRAGHLQCGAQRSHGSRDDGDAVRLSAQQIAQLHEYRLALFGDLTFLYLLFEQRVHAQQLQRSVALSGDVPGGAQQANLSIAV